ncbi:1-acyl-sn-glycerol-3-phosphate acyltransferase, partial [Pseudomonas sp. FSL R10-0071]|nr:1-acyl-sn-glycerol-3-phosphate acyltransferase [Pseudomonas sp. FSL R10-0071]
MNRLRLYGRVVRVLAVVSLGLGMASIFALLHRLHLNSAMDRRQRWTQFFMKRLSNALPFQVTVVGERPVTPMLW